MTNHSTWRGVAYYQQELKEWKEGNGWFDADIMIERISTIIALLEENTALVEALEQKEKEKGRRAS